jgi:putative addiction module antidote
MYMEVLMPLARKKLQRLGNSTGVVIPADLLRTMGLAAGDEVVLHEENGKLSLIPFDSDFDQMLEAAERFVAAHPNALKTLAE